MAKPRDQISTNMKVFCNSRKLIPTKINESTVNQISTKMQVFWNPRKLVYTKLDESTVISISNVLKFTGKQPFYIHSVFVKNYSSNLPLKTLGYWHQVLNVSLSNNCWQKRLQNFEKVQSCFMDCFCIILQTRHYQIFCLISDEIGLQKSVKWVDVIIYPGLETFYSENQTVK